MTVGKRILYKILLVLGKRTVELYFKAKIVAETWALALSIAAKQENFNTKYEPLEKIGSG